MREFELGDKVEEVPEPSMSTGLRKGEVYTVDKLSDDETIRVTGGHFGRGRNWWVYECDIQYAYKCEECVHDCKTDHSCSLYEVETT